MGGIDSRDGLAAAVRAVAAASGCSAQLQRSTLPLEPLLAQLEQGEAWCLGGGEDFELVLALEPGWAETLMAAQPGMRHIGCLQAGAAGEVFWQESGDPLGEAVAGFTHFR